MRQQLRDIKEGWCNYIFGNKNVEPLAKMRARVCWSCEFLGKFGYPHCKACDTIIKCPIATKTRCMNCKCPKNKWS